MTLISYANEKKNHNDVKIYVKYVYQAQHIFEYQCKKVNAPMFIFS